jgi:hypothetical protein
MGAPLSASNVFDPESIRQVALALRTVERYIEKDWHLVRALAVIASLDVEGVTPAFSGGTSLATAWQLINRFSEDIDFKVTVQAGSASAERKKRSVYREAVIDALTKAGFTLDGAPLVGNLSRFFRASFHYGAVFPPATGIRAALQIEMSFTGTHVPSTLRPVQSLLGRALKAPPEVTALLCVDPLETAADKIAALAWRSSIRDRKSPDDDPFVVRHLHDLAALAPIVGKRPELPALARALLRTDARRTGKADADGLVLLQTMLPTLENDALWRKEYEEFVGMVSFGRDDERISFDQAIAACRDLIAVVLENSDK